MSRVGWVAERVLYDSIEVKAAVCRRKSIVYVVEKGKERRDECSLSKLLFGYRGEDLYPMLQLITTFRPWTRKKGTWVEMEGPKLLDRGLQQPPLFSLEF